jgi:hypothetical protein
MVSVWGDSSIYSGDGCATVWIYLLSQNCTLKMVKMANFMLLIFY